MRSLIRKALLSFLLSAAALILLWYGICTHRIAANDVEFIRKHPSTEYLPGVLLLKGNLAYYVDLDPEAAEKYYREAVAQQPLAIDAWMALAKTLMAMGREEEARNTLAVVAPLISHVSTWKWQEFLLAYEMKDEEYFRTCLNFILSRLPHRVSEAFFMASNYWGDWGAVLPQLSPENWTAFLQELIKQKQVEVALTLWKLMAQNEYVPDKALELRFCEFLMANGWVPDAKEVWKSWKGDALPGMYDGGFELDPLNTAFGWRLIHHPDVMVDRTLETPFEGAYCLNLHFVGTKNVVFRHVAQVVPVEPNRSYVLKFAQRARNITTDQGVFLEVSGYKCDGLNVRSKAVTGTMSWARDELELTVPENCEAIAVVVRRNESLMFGNKITGDYWLDALELQEVSIE